MLILRPQQNQPHVLSVCLLTCAMVTLRPNAPNDFMRLIASGQLVVVLQLKVMTLNRDFLGSGTENWSSLPLLGDVNGTLV